MLLYIRSTSLALIRLYSVDVALLDMHTHLFAQQQSSTNIRTHAATDVSNYCSYHNDSNIFNNSIHNRKHRHSASDRWDMQN